MTSLIKNPIKIANTFEQAQVCATEIIDDHEKGVLFFGFDTETTIHKQDSRPSLIQFAYNFNGQKKAFLFQIYKIVTNTFKTTFSLYFPPLLKKILQSNTIVKTGADIITDMNRLKEYGIEPRGYIDIQPLAVTFGKPDISLNGLGKEYIKNYVSKDPYNHKGDWDGDLNEDQIHYAVRDAYISFQIYQNMLSIKTDIQEKEKEDDELDCLCNWIKIQNQYSKTNRPFDSVVNQIVNSYKPWRNKYVEIDRKRKAEDLIYQMVKKDMIKFDKERREFICEYRLDPESIELDEKFKRKLRGMKPQSQINFLVNSYSPIARLPKPEREKWAKKHVI